MKKNLKIILTATLCGIAFLACYIYYYSQVSSPHISKIDQARIEIEVAYAVALDDYFQDVGDYPTTEQGLAALTAAPTKILKWHGPYIKQILKDPWGQQYKYACPGVHNPKGYDLWTANPDVHDSIIGNWQDSTQSAAHK